MNEPKTLPLSVMRERMSAEWLKNQQLPIILTTGHEHTPVALLVSIEQFQHFQTIQKFVDAFNAEIDKVYKEVLG